PPIGFAHRGAKAHADENTIDAFTLAQTLGATGLETDAWVTSDGLAVLDHDGEVGSFRRKKQLRTLRRDQLPEHIPTLDELYVACGSDFELSIDLKDPEAFQPVVETARRHRAEHRLWLCHPDWTLLRTWREDTTAHLVDSTRLKHIKEGPERRAATLADVGIDAINMRQTDWSGGLTTLFHRFDRYCLGWDAQYERAIGDLVLMGIDGIFSDHVDRLMTTIETHAKRPSAS
ncbi:MAG: glycerophosphodiester phosphodiesterase, partial [Actinomycetota bacterium]|nr:glycerophosphodiester phosphodiesterase [Actinomycetota bacterium]